MMDMSIKPELQYCTRILEEFTKKHFHAMAQPLLKPQNLNAPHMRQYMQAVGKPMWLDTIIQNLRNNVYVTPIEMSADVKLMFKNCYYFFGAESQQARFVKQIEKEFLTKYAALAGSLVKIRNAYDPALNVEFSNANAIAETSTAPSATVMLGNCLGKSAMTNSLHYAMCMARRSIDPKPLVCPAPLNEHRSLLCGVSLISPTASQHRRNRISNTMQFYMPMDSNKYKQTNNFEVQRLDNDKITAEPVPRGVEEIKEIQDHVAMSLCRKRRRRRRRPIPNNDNNNYKRYHTNYKHENRDIEKRITRQHTRRMTKIGTEGNDMGSTVPLFASSEYEAEVAGLKRRLRCFRNAEYLANQDNQNDCLDSQKIVKVY